MKEEGKRKEAEEDVMEGDDDGIKGQNAGRR